MTSTQSILLVAYGNPLRRDDGAGLELARRIYSVLCYSPPATRHPSLAPRLLEVHQLVPELVNELADPALAVLFFFDCSVQGARGMEQEAEIQICNLQPATPPLATRAQRAPAPPATLTHHLTPQTLLAMASKLNGYAPPAWLVTVPGHDFGMGEGFSDPVMRLLATASQLAHRLEALVREYNRS